MFEYDSLNRRFDIDTEYPDGGVSASRLAISKHQRLASRKHLRQLDQHCRQRLLWQRLQLNFRRMVSAARAVFSLSAPSRKQARHG